MTKQILTASQLDGNIATPSDAKIKDDNPKSHLGFLTAQKMIKRFLTCDRLVMQEVKYNRFTEQELAEKLSTTSSELEIFKIFIRSPSATFYRRIAGKISLPLIKLYCSTKLVEPEYKQNP